MQHPKLEEWDRVLKEIFDEIDRYLEDTYGSLYIRHPSRPKRGKTANPESDGLFNVGAAFSAGYGSEHGRGYVVEVDMVTLEEVDKEKQKTIEKDVAEKLRQKLKGRYPDKNLHVERDGPAFKIYGDFDIGK